MTKKKLGIQETNSKSIINREDKHYNQNLLFVPIQS